MTSTNSISFPPVDESNAGNSTTNSKAPLSITLNGNKLVLSTKGRWELESSDLDVATLEIEKLLHDKEQLSKALSQSLQQVEDLSQEVREINQMKSVVLEMVSFTKLMCP